MALRKTRPLARHASDKGPGFLAVCLSRQLAHAEPTPTRCGVFLFRAAREQERFCRLHTDTGQRGLCASISPPNRSAKVCASSAVLKQNAKYNRSLRQM